MNDTLYQAVTQSLNDRRLKIVNAKRPEYTQGNVDVLNNFKVVASELGVDPLIVWYVYFRKHVASISQFCKDPSKPTSEPITERICDAINYLELLNGLIKDANLTSDETAKILSRYTEEYREPSAHPKTPREP